MKLKSLYYVTKRIAKNAAKNYIDSCKLCSNSYYHYNAICDL